MVLEQQFSTNGAGTTEHPYAKKKKKKNLTIPFTEINSKWITNLNLKHKN